MRSTMWITSSFVTWCLLLFSAADVCADTVFYTNSPQHLVKPENYTSYKLAVPGSNQPITIIEAASDSVETKVQDHANIHKRSDENKDQLEPLSGKSRKTVYSPDLLNKFLVDYAAKVKTPYEDKKGKLQEILLFDDDDEDHFPTNLRPEEKYNNQNKNNYADRRYDRPNTGWVTMDVIPWSSSTVSKWQGHVQRLPNTRPQGSSNRPDYGSAEENDNRYPSYPSHNYRPPQRRPSNDYDEVDRFSAGHKGQQQGYYHNYQNKFHEKRPYYDYHQGSSQNQNQPHPDPNKDIYRPWRGDIITDNRDPDFPDHPSSSYPHNKRHPSYSEEHYDHYHAGPPTSTPESGNGEWILVSTTKGYHRPRNGQRAVTVKPQSFTSHKSVQLAVTTEKQKPTTFSFDTANHQEPQQQRPSNEDLLGEQSMHSQLVSATKPPAKKTSSVPQKKVVKKVLNVNKAAGIDSSALLAAVGAGMVPATVAMLMPMIAGKRKKRDLSAVPLRRPRIVTHFSDLDHGDTTMPPFLQKLI